MNEYISTSCSSSFDPFVSIETSCHTGKQCSRNGNGFLIVIIVECILSNPFSVWIQYCCDWRSVWNCGMTKNYFNLVVNLILFVGTVAISISNEIYSSITFQIVECVWYFSLLAHESFWYTNQYGILPVL